MKLEYIELPDNLTQLLKMNFWPGHPSYRKSVNYILEQNDLFYTYKNFWNSSLPNNELFASLGWPLFREKLTLSVIKRINQNVENVDYDNFISEYDILEKRFDDFITSGHSRLFLVNLYFFVLEIDPFENIPYKKINHLFEKLSKKVTRVDWLIIMCVKFIEYYDFEVVISSVDESRGFDFLLENLEQAQLQDFNNSLLSYATSINDSSFFENIKKDYV